MSKVYEIPETCICHDCAYCSIVDNRSIFCSHPDIKACVPDTTEECDLMKPTEV